MDQLIGYEVYGGWKNQEHSDHWGMFDTEDEAILYALEQEQLNPKLTLMIREQVETQEERGFRHVSENQRP
jgi:hypothetical protein